MNFLYSDTAYALDDLGLTPGGSKTFYVEALRPSAKLADQRITVRLNSGNAEGGNAEGGHCYFLTGMGSDTFASFGEFDPGCYRVAYVSEQSGTATHFLARRLTRPPPQRPYRHHRPARRPQRAHVRQGGPIARNAGESRARVGG